MESIIAKKTVQIFSALRNSSLQVSFQEVQLNKELPNTMLSQKEDDFKGGEFATFKKETIRLMNKLHIIKVEGNLNSCITSSLSSVR